MTDKMRTRVAVLGTLAEFHREPIPYDMSALLALAIDISPDLLCLDMTQEQWQSGLFSDLPPEYREALLPLAHQTDIVVVPIGGGHQPSKPEAGGWRGRAIRWLRGRIGSIQRSAPGPDAVNQGWRHHLANLLYTATRRLAGSDMEQTAQLHTDCLTEEVLKVARRDPGARALVVVNVQYCHVIRQQLREYDEVEVTSYTTL